MKPYKMMFLLLPLTLMYCKSNSNQKGTSRYFKETQAIAVSRTSVTSKVTKDLSVTGTENRIFTSNINGKSYKLQINLPSNYRKHPTQTYPVLYILDGQWDFVSMVAIYGSLYYDMHIPELIIVGVTYDGTEPDYESLRASDLTPTAIPELPGSGQAAKFVQIFEQEIMPIITKNYRTNKKDNAIAGTSFAGLFSCYVLFTKPKLFNGYIINNPSLSYANEVMFQYETAFAKKHDSLKVSAFMVSGGLDDVERFHRIKAQMRSHDYKGLHLKSWIAEGMGHSGSKFEGYAKGLQYIYKKRGINLPDEKLKAYEGDYEVVPGQSFHLRIKNGHLVLDPFMGRPEIALYPLGDNTFSTQGYDIISHFKKDTNGKVIALETEVSRGHVRVFKKL